MSKDKLSEIGQAIEKAVRNDCEKNITVSFSGGIDSALVAFLASKYTNVELIAVGVKDSHDIDAAKSAAKIINLDLTVKELNDEELISEAAILQKKLKLTQFEVGFMLPFWVAAKNAKNKILMCGQGADEVFGGYARFRESMKNTNLDEETKSLLKIIPNREQEISKIFGLKLSCPYLSKDVIQASKLYSQEQHIGVVGKEKLRKAAIGLGLSERIANRKKESCSIRKRKSKSSEKEVQIFDTF